jgi:hypothetical protein
MAYDGWATRILLSWNSTRYLCWSVPIRSISLCIIYNTVIHQSVHTARQVSPVEEVDREVLLEFVQIHQLLLAVALLLLLWLLLDLGCQIHELAVAQAVQRLFLLVYDGYIEVQLSGVCFGFGQL